MSIYQQLHQTIVLFLPCILYINILSIYIYMKNIIWPTGNETMFQVLFSVNVDNSTSMASFQWGEKMA